MYVCVQVFINPSLSEVLCTTIVEVTHPLTCTLTYMHTLAATATLLHGPHPHLSPLCLPVCVSQAIAMGKWVVCADHPSNLFFKQFPNCLMFRNEGLASSCMHVRIMYV